MAKKGQAAPAPAAYVPAMADDAVKAATGKGWSAWFTLLDAAQAKTMSHKQIVALLGASIGPWWRQMVAVEYERARGLREKHQTASGYVVNATRTLPVALSALYAAAADPRRRAKWFPEGRFEQSSQTPDKYLRGAWNGTARVEFGFTAKGKGKAQIAVQVSKLESQAAVERERAAWKAALERLSALLAQAV